MRVLPRGNWMDDSGEVVEPGVPRFLPQLKTTGRATRLDLANWMTSAENPLTARVWVNRVWMHHFGEPLVENPGDFGLQTPRPVQAELTQANV